MFKKTRQKTSYGLKPKWLLYNTTMGLMGVIAIT